MTMQDFGIFGDIFEQDDVGRRILFNAALPQNLSGNQQLFGQSLFQPTFSRFLGQIGQQLQQGQQPVSFQDFLSNQGGFNFQRELTRAPSLRTPNIVQPQRFGF